MSSDDARQHMGSIWENVSIPQKVNESYILDDEPHKDKYVRLGSGKFSVVLQGHDNRTEEKVAVKVLVPFIKGDKKTELLVQREKLPLTLRHQNIVKATAEANNLAAVANAKDQYQKEMEQVCGGEKPYLGPEQLKREHQRCHEAALRQFDTTKKMGGTEFSQIYAAKLETEIVELYEQLQKHNESKNIFAAARTPAVLFSIMVIFYVLSGILGIIGLETIANVMNFFMGVALVLLVTWAYVRYSGEQREMGVHIDALADLLWDHAMGPVAMRIMQGGAHHAVKQAVKKKA